MQEYGLKTSLRKPATKLLSDISVVIIIYHSDEFFHEKKNNLLIIIAMRSGILI